MTGSVSSIVLLIIRRLLQEIQKTIGKCFKNHFKKGNINPIEKFITPSIRLNKMMISKEVTKAVQEMSNEKTPGKDNTNIELIKCTLEEVHPLRNQQSIEWNI